MDEFLKVVYRGYAINDNSAESDMFFEHFKPMLDKIKETVSEKVYIEIEEMFIDAANESSEFYALKGMNLALDVIQKKYVPVF